MQLFLILYILLSRIFYTATKDEGTILQARLDSTKQFIAHIMDITKAECNGKCIYDDNTYNHIYENSFKIDNIFNGYNRCYNTDDMEYIYFLFIDPENKEATKPHFEEFNKNLIFYYFKGFSMCLPNNIAFKDNTMLTYPDETSTYLFRHVKLKTLNKEENHRDYPTSFYAVISVLCFFFVVSLFFSIFPKSVLSITCCQKSNRSTFLYSRLSSQMKSNDDSLNNVDDEIRKKSIYLIFSDIFNLTKNLKRMFKVTNKKYNLATSYVNDNSLAFVNGLKGISIFILIYSVVFWILLVTPTSPLNVDDLKSVFEKPLVLPILYYLYVSLYLNFSINSFVFAYKFLNHTSVDNNNFKPNTSKFYKIITFILPLIYKYMLYLFLIFLVYNLNDILFILGTKTKGPFVFMYNSMSAMAMSNNINYVLPIANLMIEEAKGGKNLLFVYFYVYINEIQYFFITLAILIIYTFKKKLAYVALFLTYFTLIGFRTYRFISKERDLRDIFGYDITNYRFLYGISLYLMGALFGMLYYEYNIEYSIKAESLLTKNYNEVFSYLESDGGSINMPTTNFIKSIAKSNKRQNAILIISAALYMLLMICDFSILFPKFKANPLYKLNGSEKLYAFLELDIFVFLIFIIIWKFVIFENSILKRLLEQSFWIPMARSYFILACLLCPVTFFVVLSINYPIDFSMTYVGFLGLSILLILIFVCFIINLILEVPLKVGLKRIFKEILKY
jgi:hypothetical protein